MAFESDDEAGTDRARREDVKRSGEAGSGELGELAADLPDGPRSTDDSDDVIDAAALAALSKGTPSAAPRAAEDAETRVNLEGAAALALHAPSSVPPPAAASSQPSAASSAGRGAWWLLPLVLGFALGVPAGGVIFSGALGGEEAAPAGGAAPQLSAAEARAREGQEAAARVRSPSEEPEVRVQAATAPAVGGEARSESPSAPPATPTSVAEAAAPPPREGPTAVAAAAAKERTAARAAAPAVAPPERPAEPAAAEPAPPAAAPAPAAPQQDPAEPRTVDDLLDDALAGSNQRRAAAEADRALAAPVSVPVAPSREDVTRAMTVLLPAIRGCAAGQSGLATIGIVVRNDGRVESAAVSGAPFEGERSGRCMEGVVRRAKFPRFQQSTFRVQFPFALQ